LEYTDTVIYADIFLIINFCVDFVCLYIAAMILKLEKKALRLTLASLFGAIYALTSLFYNNFLLHLIAAFLICYISVKCDFLSHIKMFFLFLFTAVLTGGLFTTLYIHATENGTAVIAALPAAALIAYIYGKLIKERASIRTARIKLGYKGAETVFTAFVDSGNKLCDPVSGDNVVIVKADCLTALPVPTEEQVGIRFIPVRTATGSKLLRGFRPDYAEIKTLVGKKPIRRKIIVAIDDSPGSYCGFPANIPQEIL